MPASINVPIVSPEACPGERGSYFALTYFTRKREIEFRQVALGRHSEDLLDPHSLLDIVRFRVMQQEHNRSQVAALPAHYLAAIAVVRVCDRTHHVYKDPAETAEDRSKHAPAMSGIGERLGSYVLLQPNARIQKIEETLGRVGPRGFQHAGLSNDKVPYFETVRLIHLPVTAAEERSMAPRAAVAAMTVDVIRGHEPFVAIYANDDGSNQVEQFIHPDGEVV